MINTLQAQDKKQKRLVPVSHFSFFKRGQRDGLSLSSSRGKKYFKRADKMRTSQDQIISSFAKRNIKQTVQPDNDYGLNLKSKQSNIQFRRANDFRNAKNMLKSQQTISRNRLLPLKNENIKKIRKFSEKAQSCGSFLRIGESTPKKKSQVRINQKSTQPSNNQSGMESKNYEKTIKFLQRQNQYYQGLYINSQQRIQALKKETQQQKQKYERVRKIYQQKISKMQQNKQFCQKNLGHIFSYEPLRTDIVPEEVIVQNSIQCSTQDLLAQSRKISSFNGSKLSTLSLNSR